MTEVEKQIVKSVDLNMVVEKIKHLRKVKIEMLKNIETEIGNISEDLSEVVINAIDGKEMVAIQNLKIIDNIDKLNIKINARDLYTNLSKESLSEKEIKKTLINGESVFYLKQVKVLFNEIYNKNDKLGPENIFKEKQSFARDVSKITNSIEDAFKFGLNKAANEFENEMRKIMKNTQIKLEKYQRERVMI